LNPQPSIVLSEPFPLLDPGQYVATCTEASYAWARQWKKWIARLVLEPVNYGGRPYSGRLCKFLGLGKNPERPFAGPHSDFRKLFVEVNGAQPTRTDVGIEIFEGHTFEIVVETVMKDRNEKRRSPEHWYSVVRAMHLLPANSSTLGTYLTLTTDQHSNTLNTPQAEKETRARVSKGFG